MFEKLPSTAVISLSQISSVSTETVIFPLEIRLVLSPIKKVGRVKVDSSHLSLV